MDFKDHPQSISEIRSDQSQLGSDWTPRDVLISLLRDIDAGKVNLRTLFIAGVVKGSKPGAASPFFSTCAADPVEALGCIELAKSAYVEAGRGE